MCSNDAQKLDYRHIWRRAWQTRSSAYFHISISITHNISQQKQRRRKPLYRNLERMYMEVHIWNVNFLVCLFDGAEWTGRLSRDLNYYISRRCGMKYFSQRHYTWKYYIAPLKYSRKYWQKSVPGWNKARRVKNYELFILLHFCCILYKYIW